MNKKSKILMIFVVVVLCFSITAISCFAYEAGQTLTFKDTYTEAELSAYLTEYKDVDGVYYGGDEITQGVMPNFLSLEEDYSELVVLYRGSNFSTSNGDSTWLIIGKYTDGSYRIMYHYSDNSDEIYIYKTSTSAWGSAGVPEITVDGTFTLTDSQFSSTGLLWTVSGDSTSGDDSASGGTTTGGSTSSGSTNPGASAGTISEFLGSLGKGISSFLPKVAGAGVDTVDILFVTEDGGLTTVAILTIIGAVVACGLGVFAMIKKKIKKI